MCEKQCRDENGFKCHLSSEAHARQMALFGEDPDAAVAKFSDAFQASFLDLMRVRHPASRVEAQIVYNELVADRGHVHMNATVWHTLTEFVKHLGRAGLCRVDQDEKGHWWVALAAADAAAASAAAAKAKRERADAEEAAREAAALRAQMEAARKAAAAGGGGGEDAPAPSRELVRGEGDGPIRLGLSLGGPASAPAAAAKGPALPKAAVFEGGGGGGGGGAGRPSSGGDKAARPAGGALAAIMEREQAARKKARVGDEVGPAEPAPPPPAPQPTEEGDDPPWVRLGIVVKVLAPSLKGGPFYKAKGPVVGVDDSGYVAEVELPDPEGGAAVVRVDQAHCETVLPGLGGAVVLVRGRRAGETGTLVEIDEAGFRAGVDVGGEGRRWFEYEDICKAAPGARR
jgi:DNA/RNA-binding protein KIN17